MAAHDRLEDILGVNLLEDRNIEPFAVQDDHAMRVAAKDLIPDTSGLDDESSRYPNHASSLPTYCTPRMTRISHPKELGVVREVQ
jgi:hypothetical protein